jgi:ankyrin repeat protein
MLPHRRGWSPLIVAVGCGHTTLLRETIATGFSVGDKVPETGTTALHEAARGDHLQAAKILFKHGANIHERSRNLDTPLSIAVVYGRLSVVKWLLKKGADANIATFQPPLLQAALFNSFDQIAEELILHRADLEST